MNKSKNQFKTDTLFFCISILFLIAYTYIAINFVWYDNLTTFASDSANYMLMALYLSPWQEPSLPVQTLWSFQEFPPFFPLILALTGVAHNMIAAHILTALFLIVSLPLIYLFSRECLETTWSAFIVTILFAISPSTWMNILGILSENLYILISFLILILIPKLKCNDIKLSLIMGCLIACLILTRTIGISMFAAYLVVGFYMWKRSEINKTTYILPIIITLILNTAARLLHQSSVPSQYIDQFKDLAFGEQFKAMIDAWFSSWQFYWVDDLIMPYVIILMIGIFACCGLLLRLKQVKMDAVYVSIYLFILLLWPHPGQALRFVYPVQALLLIYAFYFLKAITLQNRYLTNLRPVSLFILLITAVILPALSFSYNRYLTGENSGYNHIKEFYRIPNLKSASENAAIQLQMFNDMKTIQSTTQPDDLILYFEPTYIALLANRKSKMITFNEVDGLMTINKIPEADYAYLSRLHPRKTKDSINGLDVQSYMKDYTRVVWYKNSVQNNEPVSIFLEIINDI